MAEFKLGRIRFVWKNAWSPSTTYYIDDVIRYGGRTYICAVGHASAADFNTDLEFNPTKWNQMSDGQSWTGDWNINAFYKINDVVKYGGLLYICNDSHTSAATTAQGLEADQAKWTLYAEGFDWKDAWSVSTRYKVNDLIKYGGYTYVCNLYHTSSATTTLGLEADQAKWDEFNQGIEYKGTWTTAVRYKLNDVVKYGAGLWISTAAHTADAAFLTDSTAGRWTQFAEGVEYENTWNSATLYQPGDIVAYGGNQYIAKTVHTAASAAATPVITTAAWDLFSEGLSFQQSWAAGTSYKIGEVVTQNGYTYLATADSPSNTYTITAANTATDIFTVSSTVGMVVGMSVRFAGTPFGGIIVNSRYYVKEVTNATSFKITDFPGGSVFNVTTAAGTMTATVSAEPANTSYWARLSSGIYWRDVWQDDREYNLGDAVRFGSNAYICVQAHRSEEDDGSTIGVEGGGQVNSRPDQDVTGIYWNIISIGSETDILSVRGDLVYYSGAGPTRLPIGREGQVLRSSGTDPEWVTLGETDHVYFVAIHGTDLPSPVHGKTADKPFRTIRYACEQVENGPRNPAAQRLLELNRVFIQRETTEFIINQDVNNIAPYNTATVYDDFKYETKIGFFIDALIYDLGHGGNIKSRGIANDLLGGFNENEINTTYVLSGEFAENIAAYNYALSVVQSVLAQTTPSTNYQALNGDNSTAVVAQYIDSSITAETGGGGYGSPGGAGSAYLTAADLTEIITAAIAARATATTTLQIAAAIATIPARTSPSNLIRVATGQYREILPIIVPEQTCVQGAELRSTNTGPAGVITDLSDAAYHIGTLTRMATVVGQIVQGASVTETAGNTEIQNAEFPFASPDTTVELTKLVRSIQLDIDFRLNSSIMVANTDPTGYNFTFNIDFGDARTLIRENKQFIKQEIIAFINQNFSTVLYSRTARKREIGRAVDAMLYDLTYGGATQTLNVGLEYFTSTGYTFDDTELASVSAAYSRLKTVLQQIADNIAVTKSTGNTATQFIDAVNLASGVAANAFIGARIDIITNLLVGDSTEATPPIVTVTSITGTDTFVAVGHPVKQDDLLVGIETQNGVTAGVRYYVIAAGLTATNFQLSTSFRGSAATGFTNGAGLTLVFTYQDRPSSTDAITSTTALINAFTTLNAQAATIAANMNAFIAGNYSQISYNATQWANDAREIIDAIGYDFMFASNNQTRNVAISYLTQPTPNIYSLGHKAAKRAAFDYVKTQAMANVGGNATAQARIETLMTLLDDILHSGSNEGSRNATDNRMSDYAVLQLERNRDYIVAELDAYIYYTNSTTVTAVTAATDTFTCVSTAWMQRNAAIRFSGTVFGGVATAVTYYVQNVVSATEFKIATVRDTNTAFDITANAAGTMAVLLDNQLGSYASDVNAVIDALKYDLKYPGNYKSLYEARYYANRVVGSLEENLYLLRDATGLRDQTMEGLTGDRLPPNEFGTSRVSAGAFASLDPGWGPDDYRTWINTRSPYVQGLTTLGTAAVGQKIDGALHNGGNDSIVSNDFTQVISDGIGAWITNNGRAEMVSVFSYYAHIAYLAENGGRIRATNGNNSYGDFGSVAEGVDLSETPGTAVVDNRLRFNAVIDRIINDGSALIQFEFANAGIDYTEATYTITGAGASAVVIADEFRDEAVYQVRMLDQIDDSTLAEEAEGNFGGFGYVSNANTAQGGTATSVTIAATDGETSTAYIGMKIVLTGGAGVGQFGLITTYNAGTKVAGVVKESNGTAGFDHMIAGTAIATPDASTTYIIEPAVSFAAPAYSSTAATLPTSGDWRAVKYGETAAVYASVTGTYAGTGTGAQFSVIRNGWKYTPSIQTAGTGYVRLETITLLGTSLGGTTTANDLVITITAVNSVTGAILDFDHEGYGIGGRYVALRDGSVVGATSEDGITWTTRTGLMPSAANWSAMTAGLLDDGISVPKISKFVAVAGTSANTTAAYSADGITWSAASIVTSATWVDVTFAAQKFVAISSDVTTVRISLDGENWDQTGTLTTTGFTSVAGGKGRFVAIKTGSNTTNYVTTAGVAGAWIAGTLPSSSDWSSIAYGNNRFVAVSSGSTTSAYSLDGITWTASATPAAFTAVTYGQGVFLAVSATTTAASSPDGVTWTARTTSAAAAGHSSVTFGNRNRYGQFVTVGGGTGTTSSYIRAGATARARAIVAVTKIVRVNVTEPGSAYDTVPAITFTDPNNVFEAPVETRLNSGVLANPTFVNRGIGYVTSNAEIASGDGYSDLYQPGNTVAVRRLSALPTNGANVAFSHLPHRVFKLVSVLGFLGENSGSHTAFFRISPPLTILEAPDHLTLIETRLRYSQARLTGHDFLDIGTGNFVNTNYPNLPLKLPIPANETVDNNGGRVFFTSTDQDGNFRVGDLFSVEQSTGIATLNADEFNVSGLQELSLGDLTLGGNSATITEFSTDPFFTADSDNIVPTQRAIRAFIAGQIGGGGASLNVNSVTAGSIFISTNVITTTTGGPINMNAIFEFRGGVTGLPLAFNYFLT